MGRATGLVLLGVLVCFAGVLGGCGRFRGIPSHGGGKRFFIEQELVAATARAVAKDIDVTPLKGKRCALYVISMGDQGAGNILGGRYSWDALLRGGYQSSADTKSDYPFLPSDSTTVTTDNVGALVQTLTTNGTSAINAPSETWTEGYSTNLSGGARLNYPGTLHNEAFINPKDGQFLNAVIHEALAIQGVLIVPPQQADVDVYCTVDAFGTCRDRYEFHVYNLEVLTAKTAMSMCAFDRRKGGLLMEPQTAAFEAEYKEEFIAWCGPFLDTKTIRRAENLLVDFKGLGQGNKAIIRPPAILKQPAKKVPPETNGKDRTRPKDLTKPLAKPDPNRPEDLR